MRKSLTGSPHARGDALAAAPPAARTPSQGRWRAWLRILVSAALLGLVATRIDFAGAVGVLAGTVPLFVALTLLSMLAERLYAAYRWWILLRVHDPSVRFGAVLRVVFVANFFGMFLPGGGIEVVRVLAYNRSERNLGVAFASVAIDRILGLLTLLAVAVAGCAVAGAWMPEALALSVWIGLGAMVLATAVFCIGPVRRAAWGAVPRFLAERLHPRLQRLSTYLKRISARPGLLAWALVLAVGIQLLRIVTVLLAALSLQIHAPLAAYAFVPLIIVAQLLPIGVGGLGVRESAFVFFFGTAGVAADASFALSLLIYVATIVSSLPGAWLGVPVAAAPEE